MNRDIFDKNMEYLKKEYPDVVEKINHINIDDNWERGGIEKAENGSLVLFQMVNGRKWYKNSRLNPDLASEIYASRYCVQSYEVYFIFGFSDGKCIRNIMNKCDDTNLIFVFIPNLEMFILSCQHFDFNDIIRDKRVILCFAEILRDISLLMQEMIEYTRIKLLEFCILPGYDILYHDMCEEFMDQVLDRMKNLIVNKSTQLSFNRTIPQRILSNMKRMIGCSNIKQLKDKLKEYNIGDIPVIIVSAGPSLDKNVNLLKKLKGKSLIIAVDASIRAVMQAGVTPDLLCSVDPNSPEKFISGLKLDNVYWACNQLSSSTLLNKYAKHIFYYGSYGMQWNEILKEQLDYTFPEVSSGGSVSTEAFSLAIYLGFKKIILIGQDLAFTGGVSHTQGIENALGSNDEYIKRRKLVEVEGIDGEKLQTDFQMWFYKQWFEKAIRICNEQNIQVIDATEGGARIEGAEIMSLQEVIDIYGINILNIYEIEQQIPSMFSGKKQKKLQMKLKEMRNNIVSFQNNVDGIIMEEKEMLTQIQLNTDSQQITKILRKLSDLNRKMEAESTLVVDYITMYAADEEYEVGEDIYAAESIEPKQLVEKSLALLKGYQKGAKLFLEDFDQIIMNDEDSINN